jgi:cytochrome c biogenesis protein CcmG/thiol:disulfide interchange protein DsbE
MAKQPIKKSNNSKMIIGGVVLAIVIAFVIAIVAGGSKDSGSSDTTKAPSSDGSVSAGENQPVEVVGEALEALSESDGDSTIGLTAPTLNGYAFDGSNLSVTPGDGNPYMVVFLAHWCPHCNDEVPRLIEWKESGAVPADLQVIAVSTGVASDRPNYPPSQWVVNKAWPWPVMADSKAMDAARAYGVSGYPFFVIVGADGKVKARASGELGTDRINQIVTAALSS